MWAESSGQGNIFAASKSLNWQTLLEAFNDLLAADVPP